MLESFGILDLLETTLVIIMCCYDTCFLDGEGLVN